jgi:hypothetical protein
MHMEGFVESVGTELERTIATIFGRLASKGVGDARFALPYKLIRYVKSVDKCLVFYLGGGVHVVQRRNENVKIQVFGPSRKFS